jgi:hypothetical protein
MRQGTKSLRAAFLMIFALLAVPASALAAPPANDDFADRQVLSSPLPIELTQPNAEATAEAGEPISVFAAGHSVWFEWEATSTGWVTVGTCDSDFDTVLGIFTVAEGGAFTRVAEGNPDEGPNCPYRQAEYTFKAQAGTKYVIGVDGNAFPGPTGPPVSGEGTIELRIETTDPPANDAFAAPGDLTAAGKTYELESPEPFYFARLEGYNWGATKQAGEPEHEGDPGGASVWYEWVAPATGTVRISACCFAGPLIGVYTGNSVEDLTEVPTISEFPPEVRAEVIAGQAYRIAVDGRFDEATGEATQVWFSINASMSLPAPIRQTPNPFAAIPRAQPPELPGSAITQRTLKHPIGLARFGFTSTVASSSFQCKLDKGPFRPCKSPKTYRHLKAGRHTFKVRAVSSSGLADPTAAVGRFRIAAASDRPSS